MKDKTFDWIIFVSLLLCIILLFICMIQIKGRQGDCVRNPMVYGARKLSELNDAEFSCTCSIAKIGSPIIKINSNEMKVERLYHQINSWENISLFNNIIIEDKN